MDSVGKVERASSSVTDLQTFRYKPRDSPRDLSSRDLSSRESSFREPPPSIGVGGESLLRRDFSRDSIVTSRDSMIAPREVGGGGGLMPREPSVRNKDYQQDESDGGLATL